MEWPPDPDALRGRVAVVAGATRGAGRGIARHWAKPARPWLYMEEVTEQGLDADLRDYR